jgi:hypothetical protein
MKNILRRNILLKKNKSPLVIKKEFSYIYHNYPAVPHYWVDGKIKILDYYPWYNTIITQFLNKRWINKDEIPPKINVLTNQISSHNTNITYSKFNIVNFDENILHYMHDAGYIDRNYTMNILLEPNEIELNKEILNKIIMNGYVIKYLDNEPEYIEYNNTKNEIDSLVKIFYEGKKYQLTELEKLIQTKYILLKWEKNWQYKDRNNTMRKKSDVTDFDMERSMGMIAFSENLFKKGTINIYNILQNFNFNKYLDVQYNMRGLGRSTLGKLSLYMNHNEFDYRNRYKVQWMAQIIMNRLSIFLNSEEFTKVFESELDFYISNAILSMHLWLICQRLNNFKRSKLASELVEEIIKKHKNSANKEFQKVDTLRKISKFKNIQELYEEQKNIFHYHFNIYNPTVENPFLKIDSLVWKEIFRGKIPRYDKRVYKMSHYLIYHFNKFKELTFDDFENFNYKFELDCIPFNYKDQVLLYNPQLDEETLLKETFSDFNYKKYTYEYKTQLEKDPEQLKKTFIRLNYVSAFDKKNHSLSSRRPVDTLYDELKDEEKIAEFEFKFKIDFEKMESKSILNKMYVMWYNKYFNRVNELCESEDKKRENNDYSIKFLDHLGHGNNVKKRFSENLSKTTREKLYDYRNFLQTYNKTEDENYQNVEMKIFHPDANIVNKRRRRKPLVDKIFKL